MNVSKDCPLVSVVLTTYNGEKFLHQQIDSLFAQTYSNIEVIASDDGSTDDTVNILKSYAAKHPGMKVFVNETNLGFVQNFDKCCSVSGGELIALCDQDDFWHPDKIKKMVEGIGKYSMIYCDSYLCDHSLQKTGAKISDFVNCRIFDNCLQQAIFCRIYGNATLFTRELYNRAHPFITIIPHDWWLSFIATLQNGIVYLPEPFVFYRQHSANLIGAIGFKKDKAEIQNKREEKQQKKNNIRQRMIAFYNTCPDHMVTEKKALSTLVKSYENFSLMNNFRRFFIFLRYRDKLLSVKKHSSWHRFFFCFKMFVKIK